MKLTEIIGNTPLVEVNSPNPKVKIYGKLEGNNPGGSVKDRAAFNMIQSAMERGELKRGDTLIEATSGNTGIALAMVARILEVKIILVMPDSATEERKQTMRAYGAELVLTPAERTIEYSRSVAIERAEKYGYVILNQFDNSDNWKAHFKTTGPEIWRDTNGEVTHFVSAMGTTGTITGTSKYLKSQNERVEVIGMQPKDGSQIPGIRRWSEEMRPAIYDPELVDQVADLSREDAVTGARNLALKEGILAGMSSGGAYIVAQDLAQRIESGVIVFIVCDRGDRYLSSGLFE